MEGSPKEREESHDSILLPGGDDLGGLKRGIGERGIGE